MKKSLRKNTSRLKRSASFQELPSTLATRLDLLSISSEQTTELNSASMADIKPLIDKPGVLWLNASGLASTETLSQLGQLFQIHPLAQEDIVHTHQRPKVEEYDHNMYIVCRVVDFNSETQELSSEQISIILGKQSLLTFQEDAKDCFDGLRKQLKTKGLPSKYGPDFLMYRLLDAMVDSYFPILEAWSDTIDDIQENIISGSPSKQMLQKIYGIKKHLLTLRKVLWPQREALLELMRSHNPLILEDTKTYIRDSYDHVIHLIDFIETEREVVSSLIDLHLSQMGYRMNEIMKVLTIISTIFMPMTFITGLYGMNFRTDHPWNMPELSWQYGYLMVWAILIFITSSMLLYFWKKGWLSKAQTH